MTQLTPKILAEEIRKRVEAITTKEKERVARESSVTERERKVAYREQKVGEREKKIYGKTF